MKIKTACGIEKYNALVQRSAKQGIMGRLRLYWFVVFAWLRDMFK